MSARLGWVCGRDADLSRRTPPALSRDLLVREAAIDPTLGSGMVSAGSGASGGHGSRRGRRHAEKGRGVPARLDRWHYGTYSALRLMIFRRREASSQSARRRLGLEKPAAG